MGKKFRKAVCLLVTAAMIMTVSAVPVDASTFTKAVTGVKAVSKSYDSVKVSCKAKTGAKGYRFYVSKSKKGKYSLAADTDVNKAVIKGLKTGKTYYFRVRAYKGTTNVKLTKKSTIVKCAPKLDEPTIKSVKITGVFNEKVSWNSISGAEKYKIYRSKYKGKNYKCIGETTDTTYVGSLLKEKKTYYYKVRAIHGKHKSKYSKIRKYTTSLNGNASKYGLDSIAVEPENELTGQSAVFLGSSITYGSASNGISFVEFLERQNEMTCFKEAVSSTTMAVCANRPNNSYVERLSRVKNKLNFEPDFFVCQLSLNDALAKNEVELGELSDVCRDSNDGIDLADVDSVAEAIEYITVYAKEQWPNSQIVFFTVKNNGNKKYDDMVRLLIDAKTKWVDDQGQPFFMILNLWDNKSFMNVTGDALKLYMRDANHPTMAGYRNYWLPFMANFLRDLLAGNATTQPDPQESEQLELQQPQQEPGLIPAPDLAPLDEPLLEPLTEPEEEQTGYEE